MELETYSTAGVRQGAKIVRWNDVASRRVLPLEILARDSGSFDASLRIGRLGPITFLETCSQPAIVDRRAEHIASKQDQWFGLTMVLQGVVDHSHYGRTITLATGDFVLADSHAPLHIEFSQPTTLLALRVTPEYLRRHLPAPEELCGIHMPGGIGIGRVLRAMLPELWALVAQGVDGNMSHSIANHVVGLIGSCYAPHRVVGGDSAAKRVHKGHIKQLIEKHLSEAELRVPVLAAALKVSPRYIHNVFESEGETLAAYVMRRRLEECARELRDPRNRGRSARAIAFDWGFVSAAHFSRSFKTLYGVTAAEFRRNADPRRNDSLPISQPSSTDSRGCVSRS